MREGLNQHDQRENNLALILRAIYGGEAYTRVDLSRQTGLGQAAVTRLVAQLIRWNLVRECPQSGESDAPGAAGRRPVRLEADGRGYLMGALRINRQYVSAALYDLNGRVRAERTLSHAAQGGAAGVTEAALALWANVACEAERRILGLGIALPGPYSARTGKIALMSGFRGWEGVNVRERFAACAGIPVWTEHDANCGALAELWYGGHRRDETMLFVVGDQGIGAGIVIDGAAHHGANGFAGEIGHASVNFSGPSCECGSRGCLELYASTRAMRAAYLSETFSSDGPTDESFSTDDFLSLVCAGDARACRIYRAGVTKLAFGLVGMINALDPHAVVFADRITRPAALFLDTVRETLRRFLLPEIYQSLALSVCTLPGDPMLLGAGVAALTELLRRPSAAFGQSEEE